MGINTHTSAVIRRLVEIAAHVCQRLILATAGKAQLVQQLFRRQMVADNFAILANIYGVKRMQKIFSVYIYVIRAVFQHVNYTRRTFLTRRHNSMQAKGCFIQLAMRFDIFQ